MTAIQEKEIIKKVKQHSRDAGCARVGWGAEEVLGAKQPNHILNKLAGKIVRSRRFVKEISKYEAKDWDIYVNQNYENKFLHDVMIAIISAVLSLGVGWLINREERLNTDLRIRKLESEAAVAKSNISHLNIQIKILNDSLKVSK